MTALEFDAPTAHVAKIAETVEIPIARINATVKFCSFTGLDDGKEHLLLIVGTPDPKAAPLVRVHSECLTGDLFGSLRCDCGQQLTGAMERMAADGGGYIAYLRQEGRGIGLYNKLAAYRLQDEGFDTFEANHALGLPADSRDYAVAAQMLRAAGVTIIRLITNNPDKIAQLEEHGITVRERIALPQYVTPHNAKYLATKQAAFKR
ncbi:MAG TPA: GTP cyclohydrolase II [Rhizomicrobium sp.]|jgi:GTP cyclohydrolase II|nr:GTP cyclohydrolase II [Rhizomicrobium sp.]